MDQSRQQTLASLGRTYYHPSKCLNCDAPVTLLQHLLDPSAKMSTEYYVEVLSYIFGLKHTDTGTLLLRLLNINEYTFCKPCTQLLAAIRTIRKKFVHQTKKNSYLYHAVVNNPKKTTEPATNVAAKLANIMYQCEKTVQNNTQSLTQNQKTTGNLVQPVHVVIDDELEIIGQSKSVVLKTTPLSSRSTLDLTQNTATLSVPASFSELPKTVDDIMIQVNRDDQGQGGQKYSVMQVILQALGTSSTGMLSIKGIQHHIAKNYPWYDAGRKEWHDALLAMLQRSEYFAEVRPNPADCGTTFWKINPKFDMYTLVQETFRKQASNPVPPARTILKSVPVPNVLAKVNLNVVTTDDASSYPKSDLVITSVTSMADTPKGASPQPNPVVVEFGTTAPLSKSISTEKEAKRTTDRTHDESNEHSSKIRRLNEDPSASSPTPIEVVLPDTPSPSGESRSTHSTDAFLNQKPETEKQKSRSMNQKEKEETKVKGDDNDVWERLSSPDFEIISSDDDISGCGSDKNDAGELKRSGKNPKAVAKISACSTSVTTSANDMQTSCKYQDMGDNLEVISSDEEILSSDIETKFEPVSYNAQHLQVNSENTIPSKVPNSMSGALASVVKSHQKDSLLDEKSETPEVVPDLLEEAMPKIKPISDEAKPEGKSRCMILLHDSAPETSSSTSISIRNDLFEAQPSTSASVFLGSMVNLTRSASDQVELTELLEPHLQLPQRQRGKRVRVRALASEEQIVPGSKNKIMVNTPKGLQSLETVVSALISVIREQFRLINEDLNALQAKCFFINTHQIVSVNLKHRVKKESWSSFVDILKITKNVADTVQRTFLMLDQTMIKIRILAPQRLKLDDEAPDYRPHTNITNLPVDTLAKYFKIALQAEEFVKSADYKDFRIVLKIIKYKVIRIVKHFTPKDNENAQGNVNDSYFYNICNYLRTQENEKSVLPEVGGNDPDLEDWSVEKAIRLWDQVKLFKHQINVNIVNLDHSVHGIAGFEKQLSKICIGAKRRREQQQLQSTSN